MRSGGNRLSDTDHIDIPTEGELAAMADALAQDQETLREALERAQSPTQKAFAEAQRSHTTDAGARYFGEQKRAALQRVQAARRERAQ